MSECSTAASFLRPSAGRTVPRMTDVYSALVVGRFFSTYSARNCSQASATVGASPAVLCSPIGSPPLSTWRLSSFALSRAAATRPIRIAAYRVASLQSGGLDAIVQNEGHGTCGGDARAEAAHLAVVGDGIAARWRCQAFHSLVGEPLRHAVCPHYVRSQRDRGV